MRILLPLLCLLLSLPAQAAADPKLGKPLHDKQCVACHVKLLGGDGSAMYTRKPRLINDARALGQRVAACSAQTNAKLVSRRRSQRRCLAEPDLLQVQIRGSPAQASRRRPMPLGSGARFPAHETAQNLTPGAAQLIGLVFVASGIFPMLAAFDVGPLASEDINGPPWLGFTAAASSPRPAWRSWSGRGRRWRPPVWPLALAGLAAIGNWIAFGAGERACSGSISLPRMSGDSDFSGLGCRIPFGLGALITDAFLCYMIALILQKALGGPPRLAGLLKARCGWSWRDAPLMLLLSISVLLSAAAGALKTRWTTGAWPRNEEFIVRQKAKEFLGSFGGSRPDELDVRCTIIRPWIS